MDTISYILQLFNFKCTLRFRMQIIVTFTSSNLQLYNLPLVLYNEHFQTVVQHVVHLSTNALEDRTHADTMPNQQSHVQLN